MCDVKDTYRYRSMEVGIKNAATGRFELPLDQILQAAKRIDYIEAFSVSDISCGPDSGAALQADDVFKNAYLTLITVQGNEERISRIPLQRLNTIANNGVMMPLNLIPINVNACYITVPQAAGTPADPDKVFLLGWHYISDGDKK